VHVGDPGTTRPWDQPGHFAEQDGGSADGVQTHPLYAPRFAEGARSSATSVRGFELLGRRYSRGLSY
jgi:hypothetical protein